MEEKIKKLDDLKRKASSLKKEVEYYNALQTALKLVLNGSYGAFATKYFILFNEHVAGTITAQGRDLTQTMHHVNEDYWYNQWHLDKELHNNLCIKDVTPIEKGKEEVSIYADTDSLFVSFKPAIDHCKWKNIVISNLDKIKSSFIILEERTNTKTENQNCLGICRDVDSFKKLIEEKNPKCVIIDGFFIKNRDLKNIDISDKKIYWNWANELDFIHGVDFFRYGGYFRKCLDDYALKYGVENKEDFELERISESIINIAKKKYIQHIVYEDGIPYDRLSYLYPKGVELVRSSTPAFARDKIVNIVKYLFSNPETFSIRELVKLVKNLRKEFDLCVPDNIDDISMQSSCSNYEDKVINDKTKLEFVSGAHFAVKASAYYNYLLYKNPQVHEKYEYIKSGTKIKYYYCKGNSTNDVFAYIRGSYPIEIAPEIDLDEQFLKSILSPINSIIAPLGLPEITKRLSVVMDILQGDL